MTLEQYLQQTVESWERLGAPALMERFVLRNGRKFPTALERIGPPGESKQCFMNAAKFVMQNIGCNYVEGFVLRRDAPIMPFLHAWVTIDGTDVMDPTLDASEYEYHGFVFDRRTMNRQLHRNKVYGMLDPGYGLNHQLMFKIDPPLKKIVNSVVRKRAKKG